MIDGFRVLVVNGSEAMIEERLGEKKPLQHGESDRLSLCGDEYHVWWRR